MRTDNMVQEFFKRQNAAFYLSAAACILTIIALILTGVSNSVQGYNMASLGGILASAIIALILTLGGIVLADRFGSQHWLTCVVNVIALVLLMVAFGNFISERAVLASAQFSYDSVNEVGWTVLNESIGGIVLYFISAILLAVGSFFKDTKKAQAKHCLCK